ncbi:YtpI family protein [Paenibacillus chartarius]|uniref:YtpI family protein n=1 Tax=Paenibacillus chartarius TaxID=747481 RepID=A0ABV6DN80_9BACL
MLTIQVILLCIIVFTVALSIGLSIRMRRELDPGKRGLYNSRLNISMGIMLISIAVSQLFFFNDSNLRRVFGTVCLLLGLFNLFAGIRNHGIYTRLLEQPKKQHQP